MTDQYTKDFFENLPDDKPTTWAWDDAPNIMADGRECRVLAYDPRENRVVFLRLTAARHDRLGSCYADECTLLQPAPKTLTGMLYQGWSKLKSGTLVFDESLKPEIPHLFFTTGCNLKEVTKYGYRELDPTTGIYGPLVIVGGGDE